MGKQRNRRHKLHLPANSKIERKNELDAGRTSYADLPVEPKDNIFEGIDIFSLLNNSSKPDDAESVKSHISNKSVKGEKVLPKKEKLKIRREMLLKKIDTVNQLKKEQKLKAKKRKSTIRDSSLLDNLPSLELLYKFKDKDKTKSDTTKVPKKKKAIEKSKKIQKTIIQNISIYKKLLKNSELVTNPFEVISGHLKAVVEHERKLKI